MTYEKPRILSATEVHVAELQAFLRKSPSLVYPEDVMPYVDAVETEVLALQAENEKLQEESQSVGMAAYELGLKSMAAENAALRQQLADVTASMGRVEERCAKLRELVAGMWPHVRHRSSMCKSCELPCDTSDECLLYEPMRKMMRELGIEVG